MTPKERRAETARLKAEQEEAARRQFRLDLPLKLLLAMAWAHRLGGDTHVEGGLAETDFTVLFHLPERFTSHGLGGQPAGSCVLANETASLGHKAEEWELLALIGTLQRHETFLAMEADGLKEARAGFDALTPRQREALNLKHRP